MFKRMLKGAVLAVLAIPAFGATAEAQGPAFIRPSPIGPVAVRPTPFGPVARPVAPALVMPMPSVVTTPACFTPPTVIVPPPVLVPPPPRLFINAGFISVMVR